MKLILTPRHLSLPSEPFVTCRPWPTTAAGWDEFLVRASLVCPKAILFYMEAMKKYKTLDRYSGDNIHGSTGVVVGVSAPLIAALERRYRSLK